MARGRRRAGAVRVHAAQAQRPAHVVLSGHRYISSEWLLRRDVDRVVIA